MASREFVSRGLSEIGSWVSRAAEIAAPHKRDQDKLDACLCLLVAIYLAEQKDCLMVGDLKSGYIVAPHSTPLQDELDARCNVICRPPSDWVRVFRFRNEAVQAS